jgi:hypothetical protein
MVYNSQDYWVFGLHLLSVILKSTVFQKLDLFPSSGEGCEAPILLRSLERANLNHWTSD